MKDIWKIDTAENKPVRLFFPEGVDPQIRKEIMRFLRWIRKQYVFPRSLDIQISGEPYVSTFLTDEEVSAGTFIPDNEWYHVLVRVAAGGYAESVQRDGRYAAVCPIPASIAHEITHYYQWVVDHDCVFDEGQARAKAKRTVLKYWGLVQDKEAM